MDLGTLFSIANIAVLIGLTLGLDRELSCAVCRAIVYEVNYSISKVDPKKKIQVGSYRVDGKGNQALNEKPYARSEVFLIETFEGVCSNFKDYAEATNDAGKRSIGRTAARDGKALALKNMKVSPNVQKLLKFKCENLVEDYEEEMISLFRKDNQPDIEKIICGEIIALCSEADLQIPMPVTEYAVEDLPNLVKDSSDDDEPLDEMAQYIKDMGRNHDKHDPLANAHTLDEMNQYIKDHSDSGNSIAADTVIDPLQKTADSSPPADKTEL